MPYFMIFFSKRSHHIQWLFKKKGQSFSYHKKANYYGLFAVVYKV